MSVNIIHLVVGLFVFAIAFVLIRWGVGRLAIPEPFGTLAYCALGLLFILWLLQTFGIFGPVIHIGWMLPNLIVLA